MKLSVDSQKGVLPITPGVDIDKIVESIEKLDVKYMSMEQFDNYCYLMKSLEKCYGISDYFKNDNLNTGNVGLAKGYIEILSLENKKISNAMAKHIVSCIFAQNDFGEETEFKAKGISAMQEILERQASVSDKSLAEDFFMTQMIYVMEKGWKMWNPDRSKFSTYVTKTLYRSHSVNLWSEIERHKKFNHPPKQIEEDEDRSEWVMEVFNQFKEEILKKGILSKRAYEIMCASYDYDMYGKKEKETKVEYIRRVIKCPGCTDKSIQNMVYHNKRRIEKAIQNGVFSEIQNRLKFER